MAVRTTYRVGYTALVSVPHRASPSSAGLPHLTAYYPLLVHRHETSHPPSFRPLLAEGTLELATVPAVRPVRDFHPLDTPHARRILYSAAAFAGGGVRSSTRSLTWDVGAVDVHVGRHVGIDLVQPPHRCKMVSSKYRSSRDRLLSMVFLVIL